MERVKFRDWTHLIGQLYGNDTYVNVWNCKAEFIICGKREDELELTEKQRDALEKLKNYIIYTVNDGAINFSGQYQLDDVSYEVLRMILENNIDDALEIISEPDKDDFRERARELISVMDEGDFAVVRDSAIDYGCWDGCQGYHNRQYIAVLDGKLVLIDNGCGHHVSTDLYGGCSGYKILREITEDEAIEMLAKFIEQVAERYNYTKVEVESYELDSEAPSCKMMLCKKHNEIYFDYEECPACYYEKTEQ